MFTNAVEFTDILGKYYLTVNSKYICIELAFQLFNVEIRIIDFIECKLYLSQGRQLERPKGGNIRSMFITIVLWLIPNNDTLKVSNYDCTPHKRTATVSVDDLTTGCGSYVHNIAH